MKHLIWCAALLALSLLGAAQAEENTVIDRIVAVVDKDIILASELEQYVQYAAGSPQAFAALSPSRADSMRAAILEELIRQKVLLAKARADTVKIEERNVDAELDARVKTLMDQAGGQSRLEEYYGMPLAKLKRQFRTMVEEGMLIEKVRSEKFRDVKATPNDVQRFWEAYRDSIPELKDAIRIAHILLADSLSQVSIDAAVARADSARALILSGAETFEEYASRYSEDPGSKAKGGALGTTNRGDLVPEYEAAAFSMEPGDISAPVVSQFGVHVIRLNERIGEKVNTSHILFKIVPTPHDMNVTKARADSIIEAARGGADFADLAKQYSTDIKTAGIGGDLGWFTPADLPDDFRDPVVSLKKGELAEPVRTQFGVHVLRVTDRVFARKITFEEDYERIKRMALAKKQDEVFQNWVAELEKETFIERK